MDNGVAAFLLESPHHAKRHPESILFAIIQAAGWPIWPLLLASVIAVALIIERSLTLRHSRILPPMLLDQVVQVYQRQGVNDDILRHARVRISYRDLDGHVQAEESDGLRAVCHQHEIDQLNGLFWIQRLSRLKRERLLKRFEKQSRSRS